MDFSITLSKPAIKRAEALQAKLHLQDISLYESESGGAGPPTQTVEPVRLSAELDSEINSKTSAGVDFAVTLRVMCEEPLAFHIQATFLARYRFAENSKPSTAVELDAFRKSYAVLAVWPYLREYMQNTASRMGFPTEPLPLLRLALQKA